MAVLPVEQRNKLERTIIDARDVSEAGAKTALEAIAVHHHELYDHMSPDDRKLRNHLRARARQLGDRQNRKGELEITHLVWECAYEHWHRMLFARFLAENELLIEPEMGVAISLEECEELAKEDGKDLWSLASEFAQRMLPQIFRPNDPILRVTFASEHKLKLEKLLNDLIPAIFKASDSLGWVYQFWQSKRKKEVNQSGNKIGADELPAVTQLFTDPYMVSFILDNSLGAWWAARRLTDADLQNTENEMRSKASLPGVPLEYLRFVKLDNSTWTPAAGTFDEWPNNLGELKILDPCCGSGHFLVAAFQMIVPMRIALEGLSVQEAVDRVLDENIHGLELDPRCVALAAFALALSAWRYPNAGGYRPLPELNVACSGLAISRKKEEWIAMAGDNNNLRIALEELHKQFKDAPVLGSLINPAISLSKSSMFELKWEEVGPLLAKALSDENDDEKIEMGVVAQGLLKSAEILMQKVYLIITNVPYLSRVKQNAQLKELLERLFPDAKGDLATAFIDRLAKILTPYGALALVAPQNWLFQPTYKKFRTALLKKYSWNSVVRMGPGAFETISGEVVKAILLTLQQKNPDANDRFFSLDTSNITGADNKAREIKGGSLSLLEQKQQISNPDSRIIIGESSDFTLLSEYANAWQGICTGDYPRFGRVFWEFDRVYSDWKLQITTVSNSVEYGGRTNLFFWQGGTGEFFEYLNERLGEYHGAWVRGLEAWGKKGIVISQTNNLSVTLYTGESFDNNAAVMVPSDPSHLAALWAYCSSDEYYAAVREIDQALKVTNKTLIKVPFDLKYWQTAADQQYPKELPKPYSEDSTQWIFHGNPTRSDDPLQVAVARLLGYRWPTEIDSEIEISNEARSWGKKLDVLLPYADKDGIVCIPPVRGEESAVTRLQELMALASKPDWSPAKDQELILTTGANASTVDEWLRDRFFEQHCKLYHHRPFIWHIWDGRRKDGFHALLNYHKLVEGNGKGRQLLENLTYSYLGDWIARQKEGVKRGEGGAEDRLVAALELQNRLIVIIEGEPPFDIFVRWKPIEKQTIGWEPDINDGIRLNIRPFMALDIPGGRKGAGILRWKPNIKWIKDRGKEPFRPKEQYPWFWEDGEFTGDRINDVHLHIDEKSRARGKT